MRSARKWRRKTLRRLNPRPEMAPGWSGGQTDERIGVKPPLWIDARPFVVDEPPRSTRPGSCNCSETAPQSIERMGFMPENGVVRAFVPNLRGAGAKLAACEFHRP